MKRFLTAVVAILGMSLAATPSSAREGFFDKAPEMPPAVSMAWDSVFAFIGELDEGWSQGTFSLAGVQTEGQTMSRNFWLL